MAVSIYCPHCHRYTDLRMGKYICKDNYNPPTEYPTIWNETGNNWWIGVCNSCQRPVLVKEKGDIIYPTPLPTPTDNHIPENLRADLDEAKRCFAASCHRASAVLSRRVIQVACINKGATKNNLVDQIDELFITGVITKDIKEWATVVRWVGNDAAHADKQEVTCEDAQDSLELAEQFLHVIFVTPAIAKARRTERGK